MKYHPDYSRFTCDRRWHRPQLDVPLEDQAQQPDTSRFLLWLRYRVDILSLSAPEGFATDAEQHAHEAARQAIDLRYSQDSKALEDDTRDGL